jgi:hypothetical protein
MQAGLGPLILPKWKARGMQSIPLNGKYIISMVRAVLIYFPFSGILCIPRAFHLGSIRGPRPIDARFNKGSEANVNAGGPWTSDTTQVEGSGDAK